MLVYLSGRYTFSNKLNYRVTGYNITILHEFLFIEGKIYQGGEERRTHLVKFKKNSILNIETEAIEERKLRVTMDMNNQVSTTFDWILKPVPDPAPAAATFSGETGLHGTSQSKTELYFGARLTGAGWRLKVS